MASGNEQRPDELIQRADGADDESDHEDEPVNPGGPPNVGGPPGGPPRVDAVDVDENTTKYTKLPSFDPDDKAITPRGFLRALERAREIVGKKRVNNEDVYKWTSEVMIANASVLCKGRAAIWIESMTERDKINNGTSWEDFKTLFRERFIKKATLSQQVKMLDLHQFVNESVDEFNDRVLATVSRVYDDLWDIPPDHAQFEEETTAKNKSRDVSGHLYFAAGLRPNIKKDVLIQQTDTKDILTVARRVESMNKEINKNVSSLDIDESSIAAVEIKAAEAELAATKAKWQSKTKFTMKSSGNAGNNSSSSSSSGDPVECWYCFNKGHRKQDCRKMAKDRKNGIFRTNIRSQTVPRRKEANSVNSGRTENQDDTRSNHGMMGMESSGISVDNAGFDFLDRFSV